MNNPIIENDSVRLKAKFKTFNGEYADPSDITLKIYDTSKNQIGSTIKIGPENRNSTGYYFYDYTIPSGYKSIIYEFSGLLEGTAVTSRKTINILWSL